MSSSTVAFAGSAQAALAWSGFLIEWTDAAGFHHREALRDVGSIPFEAAAPVRSFSSYRNQRNWPGLWWSATMGAHIGYESWLERDQAMLLDFDCEVVGFAAQPFWLLFTGERGPRSHAPDFFARRRDGSGVVIDCRPDERIRPRDVESFTATARACELAGWATSATAPRMRCWQRTCAGSLAIDTRDSSTRASRAACLPSSRAPSRCWTEPRRRVRLC